jgi:hypothetical protein
VTSAHLRDACPLRRLRRPLSGERSPAAHVPRPRGREADVCLVICHAGRGLRLCQPDEPGRWGADTSTQEQVPCHPWRPPVTCEISHFPSMGYVQKAGVVRRCGDTGAGEGDENRRQVSACCHCGRRGFCCRTRHVPWLCQFLPHLDRYGTANSSWQFAIASPPAFTKRLMPLEGGLRPCFTSGGSLTHPIL